MTTSYDVETTSDHTSAMPGENAKGHQTWNPSVGRYFEPASVKRESYGGVIGALQDLHKESGNTIRAYPENFAGIIAAIQDLAIAGKRPGSDAGEKPPGGDIDIDVDTGIPEWIITEEPLNGQLWFDTRQGRLFVWVEDDWYQTNGADGLPIITEDAAAPNVGVVVPGQFWYDKAHNHLYIFSGDYVQADGSMGGNPTDKPVWVLVADLNEDNIQTTATLPLALERETIVPTGTNPGAGILPIVEITNFHVQRDYNQYIAAALKALETEILENEERYITVGENPPNFPAQGMLWYDTASLELSVFYVDDDSGQWVPTSVAYAFDEQLAPLEAAIATETVQRERAINAIQEQLHSFDIADNSEIQSLHTKVTSAEADIHQLNSQLTHYVPNSTYSAHLSQVINRLVTLETAVPDYSELVTKVEAANEHTTLQAAIDSKVTQSQLQSVADSIPSVSSFVTANDITTAINNITTEYLPRSGGVLTGSFQLDKADISSPGIDFSSQSYNSRQAFKFAANAQTAAYTTFGTTSKPWEYAWDFASDEDFCWIYNDTNKVFSITKEGPACSTLYLGDIGSNTNNGRVIHNKIDVKERLNTYQTALEGVRQAVSSSTDYASLKSGLLTALANV